MLSGLPPYVRQRAASPGEPVMIGRVVVARMDSDIDSLSVRRPQRAG